MIEAIFKRIEAGGGRLGKKFPISLAASPYPLSGVVI